MSLTTSAHWMYNPGGGFYGYEIGQSLRVAYGDNPELSRTNSSAPTNNSKGTLSFWIKRGLIGSGTGNNQYIIHTGTGTSNNTHMDLKIETGDILSIGAYSNTPITGTPKVRDVSAWYHIVVKFDSTSSTASERQIEVYINGEEMAGTKGPVAQNQQFPWINQSQEINIFRHVSVNRPYDGYIAEMHLIDGQALDPTSFGETKSGIWIPKEYSGSYGTNGFHLEFDGNASDTSGNGNNWTSYNISSYDYVPDSPTNNFPTNRKGFNQTASEGNLRFERTSNANNHTGNFPNMGAKTGKWYCELRMIDSGIDTAAFAVVEGRSYNEPSDGTAYQYTVDSNTVIDGKGYYSWIINAKKTDGFAQSETSYGTALTANVAAIIMCALDLDNGKVWWGKDGTWFNSGNPAAGTNAAFTSSNLTDSKDGWGFASSLYMGRGNAIHIFNYGQDSTFAGNTTAGGNSDANGVGDFKYAPPSGFLAMCSANLPDPAIDPAQDESSADYFDTILYTAATSNGTYTHGNLSFRPDFTWIKNRNNVEEHYLIDVVRDNTSVTNTFLRSNNTAAEGAGGVSGTTFSVTDTGYEFVETSINSGELYFNGRTYVGWNWKAGGTGVSNTDGSITSSVSANQDSGFSIVTYTGNGTAGATVGHGLGKAPSVIICKRLDLSDNWIVYHQGIASDAATDYLHLDLTNAAADNVGAWNDTAPSSTVFTLGSFYNANAPGGSIVAYCFADIDGYSKAGSYVGNGSSDGTFIHTGFRPAWVMIKRADSGNNWFVLDDARDTFNLSNKQLLPNSSSAESTNSDCNIDMLSNGFKLRTALDASNGSGGTYIYLAIAEQPFKYANAR